MTKSIQGVVCVFGSKLVRLHIVITKKYYIMRQIHTCPHANNDIFWNLLWCWALEVR